MQLEATHNIFEMYWREAVVMIYGVGMGCVTLWVLISNLRLFSIIRRASKFNDEICNIKISNEVSGPFSWGKWIVLTPCDVDDNLQKVIQHEREHIKRGHWIDLLFIQLILILEWYNPVLWLILRKLKMIHEFEVDATVPKSEKYDYCMMLLNKTKSGVNYSISHGLNSNLKIRLKMINKKNSSPVRRWSAILLLPLVALAAYGVSRPQTESVINSVKPVAASTDGLSITDIIDNNDVRNVEGNGVKGSSSENPDTIIIETVNGLKTEELAEKGKKANIVGSNPVIIIDGIRYGGDLDSIDPSIVKSISVVKNKEYPDGAVMIETKKDDKRPAIFVDGERYYGDQKSLNHPNVESVSVFKDDPEFPEGLILVKMRKGKSSIKNLSENNSEESIEVVKVRGISKAEFPGGEEAMKTWIISKMVYPAQAIDNSAQGRVMISAIITKDGKLTDARVVKGVEDSLNAEALRLVNLMPSWLPGEEDGKPVDSEVIIPIIFKLSN